MRTRSWLLALALWHVLLLLAAPWLVPGYSIASHYISELGARGTPYWAVMSWAGFAVFAVLGTVVIVRIGLTQVLGGTARVACWLLLAEPLAYVLSAVFPCDLGCPMEGGSVSQMLHTISGAITYPVTALALLLLAWQSSSRASLLQRLFWCVVLIAWVGLGAQAMVPELEAWRGLLQRCAEWSAYVPLWVAAWRLAPRVDAVYAAGERRVDVQRA